ncbi:electron transporter, putative (Protein of unknown function, DUF547) [Thalictrum thalictroides]|uniref:Electron transporter n=1 Tax=Thalictrum thalictroides TaxID=46969 RepID=A0A7J6VSD7_THATH|nr:electron transporter, putative (Protein of unknown function, DUF547) [Thalictrum thalictroides]
MASLQHLSGKSVRTKKPDEQQRKEELEREVSMLLKMLDHEEKVNKILEHTISRPDGSAVHIPSFLPPKVKELLAELAMVENEISQLETERNHLQKGLSQEQQVTKELKFKMWQQGRNLSNSQDQFSLVPPNPKPKFHDLNVDERPFETKALYFISKAIKGDYTMSPLTSNEKKDNSGGKTDNKERYGHLEVIQEKVLKNSGTQKASSPKLPPRNSISNKPMEPEFDFTFDLPPTTVGPPEEKSITPQPNKLSESIMKCLIFIFVRLLRNSRRIELEKSGASSRSTHSSLSSRSFRVETGLNSLAFQKESKQQDPYGIFDIEDSIPRDIGPYKNLVKFPSSSLDPKSISSSNSSPLLQQFRDLANDLQNADLRFLTHQQKLAFWINMYNACIMHGFLQYGVPSSPENLFTLMNKATLNIGGCKLSAIAIENFILRQPSSSNLKDVQWKGEEYVTESAIRSLYGLESLEPNITFALCCGTSSSPAVRIYTANGVSAELEKSKLDYLQASIVVTKTKRLHIPELLLKNMLDFARNVDSLVEWVCQQLPTSWSLRKSMVECFRGHYSGKLSDIVEKTRYEFEFQYLLSI